MDSIDLTHKVPIVAYDGMNVRITNKGSIRLLFYQFTKEAKNAEADVVAAVSLPDAESWEIIKALVDEQLKEAGKIEQ